VIATVKSSDPVKVITVRSTAFDAAATTGGSAETVVMDGGFGCRIFPRHFSPSFYYFLLLTAQALAWAYKTAGPGAQTLSKFVGQELTKSERPSLSAGKIVVSGGRGMGSGENFDLLYALADKIGAAGECGVNGDLIAPTRPGKETLRVML